MKDITKKQLIEEIKELHQRIAELKKSETELQQAVNVLKEEKNRSYKYFDIAEVILVAIDANQKVTFINKKGCEILGYSEDEIMSKNWFNNFVPDHDRNRVRACFAELMAGNVDLVEYFENPVVTKNRGEKIIAWHNTLLKDEKENVIGILSSGEDVTKCKLQEEALRESQERYRKLIQESVEAIYMFDPETKLVLEANNAFLALLGYTAEEVLTLTLYDFILRNKESIDAYVHHILSSGAITIGERAWKRKDKTLIDVQVTAGKLRQAGKDICFVVARDIREQKQAETALQKSEGKLYAMLQAISDLMSMIDKDFNILWANEPAKKLFGDDIIGKRCYEVFHKRNAPCEPYPCRVLKTYQDGKIRENYIQLMDKNGKIMYFHCTANVALRDERGKPTAVLQVCRNITRQKLAENELQLAKERLQALSKRLLENIETERRRIARELHDDIGQELTLLRTNLQNIAASNDQISESDIEENIVIVDRLFQRIHDLSFNLRPAILDDLGLLPALRWYTDRLAQSAKLNVRFIVGRLAHTVPGEIETACFRVSQEALTNVVRHAKAQKITVELRQNEEKLKLTVIDDGIGFDVKFAKARAATGESFGLLGMQERVILAGGSIEIESVPERGTKVRACFPLRQD